MPLLVLLLLCVSCATAAAVQPASESFIAVLPAVWDPFVSPINNYSYLPGGIVHVDSTGTVLDWRPDREDEGVEPYPRWLLVTNPRNNTVCWLFLADHARFAPGPVMRCATLANLNDTWELPEPQSLMLFNVKAMDFDGVNNNWYLTLKIPYVRKRGVSYVCSYTFDQCLKLDEIGLRPEPTKDYVQLETLIVAYDIPNRLLFRITNSSEARTLHQLECVQLDGSGARLLANGIDYPTRLTADSVSKRVFWLQNNNEAPSPMVEIFSIGYDGSDRKSLGRVEGSYKYAAFEVIDGEIFVACTYTKSVYRINANTGEQTRFLEDLFKGQRMPWSAYEKVRTFKKVQHVKKPVVEDICSSADTNYCQHFCVPKLVDGTASRSCFCPEGHQLMDLECRRQYPAYAVIVTAQTLQAVDLQTDQVTTILSSLTDGMKVDFFWQGGEEFLLFWVDDGGLFRGLWSPGGSVSLVQLLVKQREGSRVMEVVVDRAGQHIYWLTKDDISYSDGSMAIMQMAPLDHAYTKTVHVNGWEDQRDLTVSLEGKIFFLEGREDATLWHTLVFVDGIRWSSLCFRHPVDWNLSSVVVDQSLAAEKLSPHMLWVDRTSQSVELYDGWARRPRLVTHPSLADPRGMDALRWRLLWIDSQGRLWTADISGSTVYRGSVSTPRQVPGVGGGCAVRVLHPWRQREADPACLEGGGCAFFCLPNMGGYDEWRPTLPHCFCPDGLRLSDDLRGCWGPTEVFPGPPIWTPVPEDEPKRSRHQVACPGGKYSEPDDVWATLQ